MPVFYNILYKKTNKRNKTIASEVNTYIMSKEEIESKYGNNVCQTKTYSKGYDNELKKKFTRSKNKTGKNVAKEYWNVPTYRQYG